MHRHFQYQALADKYAPCAPDVAETIAKLQIPNTPTSANFVPLPSRRQSDSSQAQLAIFVREGKKVAQQLQAMARANTSSRGTSSTKMTSELSTVLEKDFTVEGKKGPLQCPFSGMQNDNAGGVSEDVDDPTPHHSADPICAAMLVETASSAPVAPNGSASKCPIRYMDKHSPEEIAHYVETHKHELPRSHEVCLRRNQKNEEQIRKLDAKYGNIVSMIEDLSHLHAPMLPSAERTAVVEDDRVSDRRVSDWAQNVSVSATEGLTGDAGAEEVSADEPDAERASHFERPLKEVRVGESPSRPWGISVPVPLMHDPVERAVSPPAPVRMPSPSSAAAAAPKAPAAPAARPGKCPFDHTKMRLDGPGLSEFPKMEEPNSPPRPTTEKPAASQPFITPLKHPQPAPPDSPPPSHQPAFINMATAGASKEGAPAAATVPQMVFNGPVFIGYPMEQAVQFMQHFQSQQQQR